MNNEMPICGTLIILGALGCATWCKAAERSKLPISVDMSRFNAKDTPGPHSSTRQRVCLNGEWDFFPIIEENPGHGPKLETPPPLPKDTGRLIALRVFSAVAGAPMGFPGSCCSAVRTP